MRVVGLRLRIKSQVQVIAASAVASAAIVMFSGCGHPSATVSVSASAPPIAQPQSGKTASLPGIPFYAKHGVCKLETVWLEPRFKLSVTITQAGKPAIIHQMVLDRPQFDDAQARKLLADLGTLQAAGKPGLAASPDACTVATEWKAVSDQTQSPASAALCDMSDAPGCVSLPDAARSGRLVRITNTAGIEAVVDYSQVYYLNSRTPWIGNASVDAKLQADGTLNEGNLQVTDQTWSTILSTIGSFGTDLATVGAAGLAPVAAAEPAPVAAAAPRPPGAMGVEPMARVGGPLCIPPPDWPAPTAKDVVYQLSVDPEIYVHDHTSYEPQRGASLAACTPEPHGVTAGSVTITRKTGDSNTGDSGAPPKSGDDEKK